MDTRSSFQTMTASSSSSCSDKTSEGADPGRPYLPAHAIGAPTSPSVPPLRSLAANSLVTPPPGCRPPGRRTLATYLQSPPALPCRRPATAPPLSLSPPAALSLPRPPQEPRRRRSRERSPRRQGNLRFDPSKGHGRRSGPCYIVVTLKLLHRCNRRWLSAHEPSVMEQTPSVVAAPAPHEAPLRGER
jgi:hypothetical protein